MNLHPKKITSRLLTALVGALLISCVRPNLDSKPGYTARTFPFGSTGVLSVLVFSEDGSPISGAKVILTKGNLEYKKRVAPKPDEVSGDLLLVESQPPVKISAQTDHRGHMILKGLEPGEYFLLLTSIGHSSICESPIIKKGYIQTVVLRPKRATNDSGIISWPIPNT